MKNILSQIHRMKDKDIDLKDGENFCFVLPGTDSSERNPFSLDNYKSDSCMKVGKSYKIRVKKYMTEPPTVTFDFHSKWNDGKPMPFVIMKGEVIKETRGMYKMKLHAEAEETSICMCCGKPLTHPVSRLYGLGPECGKHAYINPFSSEEELKKNLDEVRKKILDVTWEGYVIKSAIKEWEEI